MFYLNDFDGKVKKSINQGYEFKLKQYLSEGQDIFNRSLRNYMMLTFLIIGSLAGVVLIISFIDFSGNTSIANWIIQYDYILVFVSFLIGILLAPLGVGVYLIAHEKEQNESENFLHVFGGYKHFSQIVLASVLINIPRFIFKFTSRQFPLPSWINSLTAYALAVLFLFSSLLIVVHKYNFITALKASAILITSNLPRVLLLLLILMILNIVGAALLGLGLFYTIPYSFCTIYAFYKDVCISNKESEVEIEDNLILD